MPPTQKQGDKAADAAESKVADKLAAEKSAPSRSDQSDEQAGQVQFGVPADASGTAMAAADPEVVVSEGASPKFSTKPGDVPADPRSGKPFGEDASKGLKGTHGEEVLDASKVVVPGVDPDRIPAEVTPGVTPDAGGDKLLAAAQAKAPSLTREFVDKMGLTEQNLAEIAQGLVPPPPTPGPIHTADMYRTPGGYQQTPPGVPPEDVGGNQIHRA
jgi:hypothetical protein